MEFSATQFPVTSHTDDFTYALDGRGPNEILKKIDPVGPEPRQGIRPSPTSWTPSSVISR
jgi:hypothetical protein